MSVEIVNSGVLSFGNGETASFDTAAYIKKREKTVTGSTVSVSDAAAYPAVGLTVNIEPVQEGSGDPSPDNIRPITGWAGISIIHSGANLIDCRDLSGTSNDIVDKINARTSNLLSTYPYKANTRYTFTISFTATSSAGWRKIAITHTDGTTVKSGWLSNTNTVSLTSSAGKTVKKITLSDYNAYIQVKINFLQLEEKARYSKYVPYQGEKLNFTFPSEAGTVYGGVLDVTSGVLTITHGNIASYNGEILTGEWISDRDVYAEGTTPTTGAQVVYELETPVTYQLTPTQIEMLLGDNNVWADTGDVSLTYRVGEEWYSADPTISRSASPILSMSRTSDIENDFELSDISEYDDEFEFKELDEAELKELDEAETEQKTERNTKKEW